MLSAPTWPGGSTICGHGTDWRLFSPSRLDIDRSFLVAQRLPIPPGERRFRKMRRCRPTSDGSSCAISVVKSKRLQRASIHSEEVQNGVAESGASPGNGVFRNDHPFVSWNQHSSYSGKPHRRRMAANRGSDRKGSYSGSTLAHMLTAVSNHRNASSLSPSRRLISTRCALLAPLSRLEEPRL